MNELIKNIEKIQLVFNEPKIQKFILSLQNSNNIIKRANDNFYCFSLSFSFGGHLCVKIKLNI